MVVFSRKSKKDESAPRRRRTLDSSTSTPQQQGASYRRGRTLPGSTSHTLRNAETHALNNATPREKMHHLTNLRRQLMTFLFGAFTIITLLAIFLQQFTASVVVTLEDVTYAAEPAKRYEASIQRYLTQNPLERLRFNLDEDKMTAFVHADFPEVETVSSLGYEDVVTTEFEVLQRKPVVSWQVDDVMYYVDKHGVSFAVNAYQEPAVKIVDNSGVNYTSGTAIASERFLRFVGQAVAQSEASGIIVTEVSIPAGTSRQVALSLKDHQYQVIMSIDRSVGEQVEDMSRAINFFESKGRQPQYIDLRVKGKVFFRE